MTSQLTEVPLLQLRLRECLGPDREALLERQEQVQLEASTEEPLKLAAYAMQ